MPHAAEGLACSIISKFHNHRERIVATPPVKLKKRHGDSIWGLTASTLGEALRSQNEGFLWGSCGAEYRPSVKTVSTLSRHRRRRLFLSFMCPSVWPS